MKSKVQTENYENNNFSKSGDIFDGRYFSINKRLLSFIGQWPYQSHRQRTSKFWFILILSLSLLGPQTRSMIVTWGHLDLFVACFTPIVANIGCVGMLINSTYHNHKIRKLLDEIRKNWECMRHLPQIKILQQHGEKGRKFTMMYSIMMYTTVVGNLLSPLVPKILDVIVPLNHSRQRFDIVLTDYTIDPDKYYWPISVHVASVVVVVISVLVAIDSFYMSLAQHACGMFAILRYDLENMLEEDKDISEVTLKPEYNADIFYQQLVSCMKRHKCLIKYVKSLQSTCEWMLFLVVGISLVALSFTSYQTIAKSTPRGEIFRTAMFTVAQTYHLYCITLPGHWISEASSFLPDSIYNCRWHMMSLRSRKLIILFIRASIEPCTITAGKIYVMSIENFCTVVQTSLSYLTMLTSLQ